MLYAEQQVLLFSIHLHTCIVNKFLFSTWYFNTDIWYVERDKDKALR